MGNIDDAAGVLQMARRIYPGLGSEAIPHESIHLLHGMFHDARHTHSNTNVLLSILSMSSMSKLSLCCRHLPIATV